ncbi:hypothetical protein BS329_15405 [Amycolatopsis coloradensis]|uniref:Uncharacterized protein n=1 Tax=Amycolatopsis coloradensis TaxID=76021 RepID=A0A1R0KU72_9PSEU|nr:hypothetical protein [Amycolatopsis coloradensis]OLZ51651.1 hypothetical protein BS329_15405 [Amycolatopsis coloradensis]
MAAHTRSAPPRAALGIRLAQLTAGTLAIGLGVALLQRARLGLLPMDVLHLGVAHRFGFSLGGGIIAVQAVMLMAFVPLRIRPGIGTVAGFVVPAITADLLLGVLPPVTSLPARIVWLAAGGAVFCVGAATYLTAALGPLPRDGLMLAFGGDRPRRIAGIRIGFDVAFVLAGAALLGPSVATHGGGIGPGTLVLAFGCGPAIAVLLRLVAGVPGFSQQINGRGAGAGKRHVHLLSYMSFRHAQGSQPVQLHFMQAYARILRDTGVTVDPGLRSATPREVIRQRALPTNHLDIPDPALISAQLEFWWLLMWDVLDAVRTRDHTHLPSRRDLLDRMNAVGGNQEMSSFTDEELTALDSALDLYRNAAADQLAGDVIAVTYFLPALLHVERGFQGAGTRFPARPRTDGGDVHDSLLLTHCRAARDRYRKGTTDITDRVYHAVCRHLDRAERDDTALHGSYRALVASYNRNHPQELEPRLHTPGDEFATPAQDRAA